MATLLNITIENYRSIEGPLEVRFPPGQPVVLLGENNAGKSNIVKAINLLLGTFWPGNHDPEDHEFFKRDRTRRIRLRAEFDPTAPLGRHTAVSWIYDPDNSQKVLFRGDGGWVNGDDRENCVCIIIEAERNLAYQLSYASKFTLLSRLMRRFHKALTVSSETKTELASLFEQIKAKFGEVPEFAEFRSNLRAQLGDLISTMTHRLEVDFEAYNPTNFFHALRLQAHDGTAPCTLEEMGTGESQILAISFAHAFARAFHGGIMLVIEEPESHLHPLAQQWLARKLHQLSNDGLQMLVTTHSPHLIELLSLNGLVLVTKDATGTRSTQLSTIDLVNSCLKQGAQSQRTKPATILPYYKSSATPEILEGFFAKVVVLVEGPTEKLALPVYLGKCGLDHCREGVAVIPVHGKGSLAKWRRLFTAYGIPVYVVFDNDASDDGTGESRRDALKSVGIQDAGVETYLSAKDVLVSDLVCVFGDDFEKSMRRLFPEYTALETEARDKGGNGKPFIARYVAEHLEFQKGAPGWLKLEELARAIRGLLPKTTSATNETA